MTWRDRLRLRSRRDALRTVDRVVFDRALSERNAAVRERDGLRTMHRAAAEKLSRLVDERDRALDVVEDVLGHPALSWSTVPADTIGAWSAVLRELRGGHDQLADEVRAAGPVDVVDAEIGCGFEFLTYGQPGWLRCCALPDGHAGRHERARDPWCTAYLAAGTCALPAGHRAPRRSAS